MNFIFKWSTLYLTSKHSERVRYRVEHEEMKFTSISEQVIFCLLCKHQWNTTSACFQRCDLLCNHNDSDLFMCEDDMLSSRVKIWSFCRKAQVVFHWCLYNKSPFLIKCTIKIYLSINHYFNFKVGICVSFLLKLASRLPFLPLWRAELGGNFMTSSFTCLYFTPSIALVKLPRGKRAHSVVLI